MRDFACPNCGQRLAFENSVCLGCESPIGFDPATRGFVVVDAAGATRDDPPRRMCANLGVAGCNWIAPAEAAGGLCRSCSLTRTRPAAGDAAMPAFAEAETAKRRLVVELVDLGLPIDDRTVDPERGLAFDLLSSTEGTVTTGHADGVITLDLAEGDDVHRERLRVAMAEPYRTLLGHFRHEIGHYYWFVLVDRGGARADFEALFGDADADYQAALDRHYAEGAPAGWEERFVSAYATMHPAEDWAETFAHYLHIRDTLDTAAAFGFAPAGATATQPLAGDPGFDRMIALWLPLAWALNMLNRSMGHADLYPFVLPPAVLDKMRLVHRLVATREAPAAANASPPAA
ncbi:MAG: putative zinc-binding metallopeptidase [bacterium]|nr:putative zinc-binding metallopeptidase [bacterium]